MISKCINIMVLSFIATSLVWCSEPCHDIVCVTDASVEKSLEFTYENLFLKDDLFGKTPKDMAWSKDGRYLAYRWNINEATGSDLWIYDVTAKSAKQITTVTRFAQYDPQARTIIKSDPAKDKDIPRYAGVASFHWAEDINELLLSYRNDLYHLDVEDDIIKRLTKTSQGENNYQFTPEGDGYLYWRGASLYRVYFKDSFIEEIIPAIPEGQSIDQKIISPDHKWLIVVTSKATSHHASRKVGYVTFRDRFATWKEHNRPLAEDPDPPAKEKWIYLQEISDPVQSATKESAHCLFHHEGKQHLRISAPVWSEDSQQIVFRTYKPDTEEIWIYTADLEDKKSETIHKARNSGTQRSPNRVNPEFTRDGKYIIAMFEDSGFRQPWLIDPLTQGKIPLVRGHYDAMPISMNDDGDLLYVLANKEHPAQKDIYSVNISSGEMQRMTRESGVYSEAAVSDDGDHYTALFTNWEQPKELAVGILSEATESLVTSSHPDYINELNHLKPQLFSYKNDKGIMLHGMIFLPPGYKKCDNRPVIMYFYGGPLDASSMVNYGGFGTYNYRFPMYMAKKHGYIAAVVDPRGSSNYGSLFESANWENPGKPQVEDLTAGAKHIVDVYGGDPDRIALYGWSFGGFATQLALYSRPDIFAAGIAGAGPTEWKNYYGSYTSVTISEFDDPEDAKEFTILPLAKNLQDPLLLVHGIEDTNVLFQDTVKVYQELLKAGKANLVELVLDTAGGHHMGGDLKYNEIFGIFEHFFTKHLGSGNIEIAEIKCATSSSFSEHHKADNANDDKLFTRWTADKEDQKPWWQVDLGNEYNIQSMEIHWGQEKAPYQYKVLGKGACKNQDWRVLIDKSDNKTSTQKQHLYLDSEQIQRIKIEILKTPKDEQASIIECKIYRK